MSARAAAGLQPSHDRLNKSAANHFHEPRAPRRVDPRRVVDARAFRKWFPEVFARHLREQLHLRTAKNIARVYGCSERTAANWLAGRVAPDGRTVALYFLNQPEAIARLMAEFGE